MQPLGPGSSHLVAVGLGTNLGDRRAMLRAATARLEADGVVSGARASSVWASDAMLLPDAPPEWSLPFLNTVVVGRTTLAPHAVLDGLQRIEFDLGRGPHARWAPRSIDLDLLIHGDTRIADARLSVPHPGLGDRPFVLLPLAELLPEVVVPGRRRPLAELAAEFRRRHRGDLPFRTRPADAALARGA